jgi:ERCC4-type nuclease
MAICVDSLEPTTYYDALMRITRTVRARLMVGDYSWETVEGKRVAVERKRVADLLDSFKDDRWQNQIPKLAEYEIPILLIEGDWPKAEGSIAVEGWRRGWTLGEVEERLIVAQMLGVLRVHVPAGPEAVARRIQSLYEQTTKGSLKTLVRRPPVRTVSRTELVLVSMLMMLPYIGEVTAKKLLAAHGTVPDVFAAIEQGTTEVGRPHEVKEWQRILRSS